MKLAIASLGVVTLAASCVEPPPTTPPPTTLTVTASSATIAYGDEVPEIEATYSQTPDIEATCTTDAASASPVGTYPTTCEGATLTGKTVVYVDGTITIEPAPVTVTASSATISVGDEIPTITAGYDGLRNGATAPAVEAVCSTDATAASPAGTYASSCSGAEDDNYSFNYVDGTVEIAAAVVTVTASSATSTYGDAAPSITASYSGFQHGETEPGVPATCSSASDATSPAGTYATSCSGASDPSYSFDYIDGTVEVTPATLTVTASSASFVAGEAVPEITASYSGLVNGDTAPATPPTCSTDATSASPAGIYTSTCSGAADANYDVSYTDGTVEVTAVAAPVVVTASSQTITYGDPVPEITANYTGFGGGQTAPETPATCSTTAIPGSGVGTYETTCADAADPNYDFTYTAGEVTIVAAPATVIASSVSSTYGDPVPAITASYSGLVNGDSAPATLPTCSTDATSASPVGSYGTACLGAADPNYTFSYSAGSVTIDEATVTVTASDATFEEGGTVPGITADYAGFVNGDTAATTPATCSTDATASSSAGTYASTCSGADDPNYTFDYVDGVVTVTAATLPEITSTGYAGYTVDTEATNIAPASNGVNLPLANINVDSVAGFDKYTNLTIPTSNGAQSVFCKSLDANNNRFTGCSGGTGTLSTGAVVTNGAPNSFDVYTIMGGASAVSPSSLTVIQDIPAAFRGLDSGVSADATNGVITALPTPAATGTFNLVFGICDAGTVTYSQSDPACNAGEIVYGPGAVSTLGAHVSVSIASSDIYQKVSTYVRAPETVSQGDSLTVYAAASGTSIPKFQASQPIIGEPTVNNASGFGIVFPIPEGMEFESVTTMGGSALSSGKMVVNHCIEQGPGCNAVLTGNFDQTTLPYIQVTLPGVVVPGGGTLTMPTVALTLKATGPVGTVADAMITEFSINLSVKLGFLGNNNVIFRGYPTSGDSGTPPKAPPAILSSTEIID